MLNAEITRLSGLLERANAESARRTAYRETVAKQTDRERLMFEGGNMRTDASV